ncbi:MAG: OadG family protein [Clostridiales bacterium]|nr:OadG family protein [Clostridiales bacterium]
MSVSEALATGLQTTVVGLSIVFSVLIIIMLVLYCFKFIFAPKEEKAQPEPPKPVEAVKEPVAEEQVNEEELIAVLTAAVAASLNTSTYHLQIKSYRRVGNNMPSWNKAGVTETINNRF